MPDAEKRRQKAAYTKGIARTAAIAGVIVLGMGALTLWALENAEIARQKSQLALTETGRANKNAVLAELRAKEAGKNADAARENARREREARIREAEATQSA